MGIQLKPHDVWDNRRLSNMINELLINTHYANLQDELDVWYGSQPFSKLEKIHDLNKNDLFGRTDSELEEILSELEDEWVEWSTDTKVMWYNQIMGY